MLSRKQKFTSRVVSGRNSKKVKPRGSIVLGKGEKYIFQSINNDLVRLPVTLTFNFNTKKPLGKTYVILSPIEIKGNFKYESFDDAISHFQKINPKGLYIDLDSNKIRQFPDLEDATQGSWRVSNYDLENGFKLSIAWEGELKMACDNGKLYRVDDRYGLKPKSLVFLTSNTSNVKIKYEYDYKYIPSTITWDYRDHSTISDINGLVKSENTYNSHSLNDFSSLYENYGDVSGTGKIGIKFINEIKLPYYMMFIIEPYNYNPGSWSVMLFTTKPGLNIKKHSDKNIFMSTKSTITDLPVEMDGETEYFYLIYDNDSNEYHHCVGGQSRILVPYRYCPVNIDANGTVYRIDRNVAPTVPDTTLAFELFKGKRVYLYFLWFNDGIYSYQINYNNKEGIVNPFLFIPGLGGGSSFDFFDSDPLSIKKTLTKTKKINGALVADQAQERYNFGLLLVNSIFNFDGNNNVDHLYELLKREMNRTLLKIKIVNKYNGIEYNGTPSSSTKLMYNLDVGDYDKYVEIDICGTTKDGILGIMFIVKIKNGDDIYYKKVFVGPWGMEPFSTRGLETLSKTYVISIKKNGLMQIISTYYPLTAIEFQIPFDPNENNHFMLLTKSSENYLEQMDTYDGSQVGRGSSYPSIDPNYIKNRYDIESLKTFKKAKAIAPKLRSEFILDKKTKVKTPANGSMVIKKLANLNDNETMCSLQYYQNLLNQNGKHTIIVSASSDLYGYINDSNNYSSEISVVSFEQLAKYKSDMIYFRMSPNTVGSGQKMIITYMGKDVIETMESGDNLVSVASNILFSSDYDFRLIQDWVFDDDDVLTLYIGTTTSELNYIPITQTSLNRLDYMPFARQSISQYLKPSTGGVGPESDLLIMFDSQVKFNVQNSISFGRMQGNITNLTDPMMCCEFFVKLNHVGASGEDVEKLKRNFFNNVVFGVSIIDLNETNPWPNSQVNIWPSTPRTNDLWETVIGIGDPKVETALFVNNGGTFVNGSYITNVVFKPTRSEKSGSGGYVVYSDVRFDGSTSGRLDVSNFETKVENSGMEEDINDFGNKIGSTTFVPLSFIVCNNNTGNSTTSVRLVSEFYPNGKSIDIRSAKKSPTSNLEFRFWYYVYSEGVGIFGDANKHYYLNDKLNLQVGLRVKQLALVPNEYRINHKWTNITPGISSSLVLNTNPILMLPNGSNELYLDNTSLTNFMICSTDPSIVNLSLYHPFTLRFRLKLISGTGFYFGFTKTLVGTYSVPYSGVDVNVGTNLLGITSSNNYIVSSNNAFYDTSVYSSNTFDAYPSKDVIVKLMLKSSSNVFQFYASEYPNINNDLLTFVFPFGTVPGSFGFFVKAAPNSKGLIQMYESVLLDDN